jgi:hypothetical protein
VIYRGKPSKGKSYGLGLLHEVELVKGFFDGRPLLVKKILLVIDRDGYGKLCL